MMPEISLEFSSACPEAQFAPWVRLLKTTDPSQTISRCRLESIIARVSLLTQLLSSCCPLVVRYQAICGWK